MGEKSPQEQNQGEPFEFKPIDNIERDLGVMLAKSIKAGDIPIEELGKDEDGNYIFYGSAWLEQRPEIKKKIDEIINAVLREAEAKNDM
ncbi:MAG: hypothetical protein AUG51_02825 [Acidobacteria bacterium 13_1_20CM_3_53_8]|nr:MAG: hypothetical protein AUG51_02825 [Acidobacteria bacterium 13_1_20CM_3_53_8]